MEFILNNNNVADDIRFTKYRLFILLSQPAKTDADEHLIEALQRRLHILEVTNGIGELVAA